MIRFIFGLLVVSCPVICFSQHYYFYSDSTNAKKIIADNHIKKDVIYTYTIEKGKIKDSSFYGSEVYDQYGNLIERRYSLGKGKVFLVDSFFYNAGHHLVKTTYGNRSGAAYGETVFEYDAAGREISSFTTMRLGNGSIDSNDTRKTYNEAGRLNEKYIRYRGSSKSYLRETYQYDEEGRITEIKYYGVDGRSTSSTLFLYEKNRKRTYEKNERGTHLNLVFSYNDKGQCNSLRAFMAGDKQSRFIYNTDGTLFEWTSYDKDRKTETMDRHYYFKE